MKKISKKLSLTTTTIRDLQTTDLTNVVGGSVSVYNPSGGIVANPSGGITSLNPSGGITSISLVTSANPSGGRH